METMEPCPPEENTPGRRAFEAYEQTVVAFSPEQPLAWEALIPERKQAWENAAQAAREPDRRQQLADEHQQRERRRRQRELEAGESR